MLTLNQIDQLTHKDKTIGMAKAVRVPVWDNTSKTAKISHFRWVVRVDVGDYHPTTVKQLSRDVQDAAEYCESNP
jgi:hypothetical protein